MKNTWSILSLEVAERREIGLYADLLHLSLEKLLAEAIDLPEGEWQQQFQKRSTAKQSFSTWRRPGWPPAISSLALVHAAGQLGHFEVANLPYFQTLPLGAGTARAVRRYRLKGIERNAPACGPSSSPPTVSHC